MLLGKGIVEEENGHFGIARALLSNAGISIGHIRFCALLWELGWRSLRRLYRYRQVCQKQMREHESSTNPLHDVICDLFSKTSQAKDNFAASSIMSSRPDITCQTYQTVHYSTNGKPPLPPPLPPRHPLAQISDLISFRRSEPCRFANTNQNTHLPPQSALN